MNMVETPRANRIHIGIFGKRNAGKSSLINALTGQKIALVSDQAGTTTDPVYKAMELHPLGPVVFIDTAGFDDVGPLGNLRLERTEEALAKTEIGLVVFSDVKDLADETRWIEKLREKKIPIILVLNKVDTDPLEAEKAGTLLEKIFQCKPILISALNDMGIVDLKKTIGEVVLEEKEGSLVKGLVQEGELVLLVMPQDIQAPKGRLILPQVQVTRALLDQGCLIVSTDFIHFEQALASLKKPPKLIITDSQCFNGVYEKKPDESLLTSFSVLFAAHKGDMKAFVEGAQAIDRLTQNSRVLIAEACTHAPLEEDIGRVKIPAMLRKKFGPNITIDLVAGVDFPVDLSGYDLIIHCGACMFNKKYMMNRIARAKNQGTSITNYGVVMAKFGGILDKIVYQDI